jgi:peptide chain release factor 1
VEHKCQELDQLLADPQVCSNRQQYRTLTKERAMLAPLAEKYRDYMKLRNELEEYRALADGSDPELRALAHEEMETLPRRLENLEQELRDLLTPRDAQEDKNIFLEIRAGSGGEEAALFAAALFRMYSKYSERHGFRVEVMSQNNTGVGGVKEVIAFIEGSGAYNRFRYEGGVHRVQRVPVTEGSGRIHTSAVTVAVLPEVEEVEVDISPEDIRVDVYRSSGPGGQSVNTTDSAVRLTHLPTGMVVTCQDEKSQHKNRAKAMRILRARLKNLLEAEQEAERARERRGMVGSGDRSERIRTYNFPQNRVTDHRIGLTLHRLETFLEGDIQEMIDALAAHYQSVSLGRKRA